MVGKAPLTLHHEIGDNPVKDGVPVAIIFLETRKVIINSLALTNLTRR